MMNMKRTVKNVLVVSMVLVATFAFADLLVPPPHAMSPAEWTVAMRRYSILWRLAIPCSAVMVFLVTLISSIRLKRPSIMVWLACCSPVVFFVPMIYKESLYLNFFFTMLGVAATSGILSVVHCFYVKKFIKATLLIFAIPGLFVGLSVLGFMVSCPTSFGVSYMGGVVEPKPRETYAEYQMRANRIVFHHCPLCDKPMKEYGNYYWLCPDCNKGIMCCAVCGAKKDLVNKGLHWQDGYEWQCPNCDKDASRRQCSQSSQ